VVQRYKSFWTFQTFGQIKKGAMFAPLFSTHILEASALLLHGFDVCLLLFQFSFCKLSDSSAGGGESYVVSDFSCFVFHGLFFFDWLLNDAKVRKFLVFPNYFEFIFV